MPAQPACFHRLEEILSALRSMTSTHLDLCCLSWGYGRMGRLVCHKY